MGNNLISPLKGKNSGNAARKKKFYPGRYDVARGPNTKQWWVFDNETHEWCDVPIDVLKALGNSPTTAEEDNRQSEMLQRIVDANPAWLYDNGHRYDEDMEI